MFVHHQMNAESNRLYNRPGFLLFLLFWVERVHILFSVTLVLTYYLIN